MVGHEDDALSLDLRLRYVYVRVCVGACVGVHPKTPDLVVVGHEEDALGEEERMIGRGNHSIRHDMVHICRPGRTRMCQEVHLTRTVGR